MHTYCIAPSKVKYVIQIDVRYLQLHTPVLPCQHNAHASTTNMHNLSIALVMQVTHAITPLFWRGNRGAGGVIQGQATNCDSGGSLTT